MTHALSLSEHQKKKYGENFSALGDKKYYVMNVYNLIKTLSKQNKIENSLEIGCADGAFSELLHKNLKIKVYGIEISDSIKIAKKKIS